MSSDRISQLHEQASERYLNGDFDGALQAWRDVLAIDPANEQARDGVRLAAQYVAPQEEPPPPPELEEALEEGLSVFDSLGSGKAPAPRATAAPPRAPEPAAVPAMAAKPAAAAGADPGATMILDRSEIDGLIDRPASAKAVPDPNRQSEGIDFGDLSGVEAIPLGAAPPQADAPPRSEPAADESGLAPSAPDPPTATAAAVELRRRVSDLLTQARMKADAGERDEALAILSRLAILDEDNAEAEALRESLEGSTKSDLDAIENAIIEGVAALEADHLDEAERCMRQALALAPEHREALHYLETIQARRAHPDGAPASPAAETYVPPIGEDDLLSDVLHAEPAVPLAETPVARPRGAFTPRPMHGLEPPAVPGSRKSAFLSTRALLVLGLVAAAGVAGVVLLPHLRGGSAPVVAPTAPAAVARPARSVRKAAPEAPGLSVTPATPEDRARAVAADIADGHREIAAADFAAAVISFNDALKLDPGNADAKAGLHEAGEKYKAQKAREEALDRIKLAFRDGEYTSALRMAYRLPDGIDKDLVDRIKVRGWYDLGVVALRAGDCKEAESHFKDALAIASGDAESKRLLEFAGTCQGTARDRTFYDFVEALQFRTPQFN